MGLVVALVIVAIGVIVGICLYCRRKRPVSCAEIALRGMEGEYPRDRSRMTPSSNPSSIPPLNRLSNPSPNPSTNPSSISYYQDIKVPMVEAPGNKIRESVELHSPDLNEQPGFNQLINKPTEIYTETPQYTNEDYETAARRMEYERRLAMASEMDASLTVFELPGSNLLVEMDDDRIRYSLSPPLAISPVSR